MEKKKDWVGGKASTFKCLGASNHTDHDRQEHDFYATSPEATEWLLKIEPEINNVWENAVGQGDLAEPIREAGKLKAVSDIVDRGYYPEGISTKYNLDFLTFNKIWKGDIVTNPPYKFAKEFVEHSLELIQDGHYVCMFLKLTFLEGKERKKFFEENPPIRIHVSSSRILCAMNGEFEKPKKDKNGNVKLDEEGNPVMERQSSAACYAWFIWQKGYKGDTIIKWFN